MTYSVDCYEFFLNNYLLNDNKKNNWNSSISSEIPIFICKWIKQSTTEYHRTVSTLFCDYHLLLM